uniref:Fibronectin type-III domain-containing protein n=1 Tax=Echeneis naucrates TaxID=173247 RepID=A0A665VBK0_ECHNA
METLKRWRLLHGHFVFLLLTIVTEGSSCPSYLECFRRNTCESVYVCEWSVNRTQTGVTFDLHIGHEPFRDIKETHHEVLEERLIQHRPVNISVEARGRNFSCTSPRRSVLLRDIVKYEAPQNISMLWSENNLNLTWKATEEHPASAEIWVQRDDHHSESWEKIMMNITKWTGDSSAGVHTSFCLSVRNGLYPKHKVTIENLSKRSSYRLQIRQRSTQARSPLWSGWSPVVLVPAELDHKPKVKTRTRDLNGTREVTLTWKGVSPAAAVGGVTYLVNISGSSQNCACKTKTNLTTNKTSFTTYVSYSTVNIFVTARNSMRDSPSAVIHLPAQLAADLKACDNVTLSHKLHKRSCRQWYKLQDTGPNPESTPKKNLQDFIPYFYFEHICEDRKPRTVRMCLFYKKQGAPQSEPQDLIIISDSHSPVLTWRPIPPLQQRGFLTHYQLCSVKISPQVSSEECQNISSSLLMYQLETLEHGAKYNISLAGVTQEGGGPKASVTFNTAPEKQVNVWLSLGLLIGFFFGTTTCTVILKRIKKRIFPSVPKPVLPDFSLFNPENQQEVLEGKEEVSNLTLLQLQPKDMEETSIPRGQWGDGGDGGEEGSEGDDEGPDSTGRALSSSRDGDVMDEEQLDHEIALLIYKNGLVFDVKPESP